MTVEFLLGAHSLLDRLRAAKEMPFYRTYDDFRTQIERFVARVHEYWEMVQCRTLMERVKVLGRFTVLAPAEQTFWDASLDKIRGLIRTHPDFHDVDKRWSGVCTGSSVLFAALYYRLERLGWSSEEARIAAIGDCFRSSVPESAVLFQHLKKRVPPDLRISPYQRYALSEAHKIVYTLPPGVYLTTFEVPEVDCHTMLYIRINASLGFLFEPNVGTLKLKGWQDMEWQRALRYSWVHEQNQEKVNVYFEEIKPAAP